MASAKAHRLLNCNIKIAHTFAYPYFCFSCLFTALVWNAKCYGYFLSDFGFLVATALCARLMTTGPKLYETVKYPVKSGYYPYTSACPFW